MFSTDEICKQFLKMHDQSVLATFESMPPSAAGFCASVLKSYRDDMAFAGSPFESGSCCTIQLVKLAM
jgi:hypothetical protein